MGLERLAAVMQGVTNNFETDLFRPIVKEIEAAVKGTEAAEGALSQKGLIYAVADHIRAVTFSIFDGVMPSNEARGYVVRKIIRKSTLHLRALGFTHPFLYKLVPVLAQVMKVPYPDLKGRQEEIAQILGRAAVGRLGLIADGEPYVVPLNFAYADGRIFQSHVS
jgi:alanyl-tRNA synthetase